MFFIHVLNQKKYNLGLNKKGLKEKIKKDRDLKQYLFIH